jgi:CubicO group peptidase (beta-lactamase class C family)
MRRSHVPARFASAGVALAIACASASACGGAAAEQSLLVATPDTISVIVDGARSFPGAAWRTTTASRVGIDDAVLRSIVGRLGKGDLAGVESFLVVRRGYMVAEQYVGVSGDAVHTMQSVSKSVTSLLVGIAMDEGKLASIDRPVLSFFPEYTTLANVDAAKRALTPRHLLQMRTSMDFWEQPYSGSPLQQLNDCGGCDWLRLILDRPMTGMPGDKWAYNSGGVIALGGVLYATTGVAADEYARQKLFTPLGITRSAWYTGSPNGLPHMGGGLSLRSADLVRIGYLVLRRGMWNGQRIVSERWLDSTTHRVTASTERYFPRNTDYGMLWWLFPRNNQPGPASGDDYVIAASGSGGQWMFIDPKNDLVVVFTGALGSGSWPGVQVFFDELLPAVR